MRKCACQMVGLIVYSKFTNRTLHKAKNREKTQTEQFASSSEQHCILHRLFFAILYYMLWHFAEIYLNTVIVCEGRVGERWPEVKGKLLSIVGNRW